ncbi:MAG TPA: SgcJ/EcaC family oxidoreductase [Myxococcota bacterium]|nr:SgcJ/EcaC family oxidoreductase [Myxococcota bacterium]
MSPSEPEDWPRAFEEALDARDLEAVVALYAPDARFVARSGETLVGRDAIRPVLAGLIAAGTRFRSRVVRAVVVDDVAILYTDFEGTSRDASGRTVEIDSRAIEVLRRQPDRTWKLIVGDPNGRGAGALPDAR